MTLNLADLFCQQAAHQPSHPAILGPKSEASTYADLLRRIQGIASQLRCAGIESGMNIGLHYPSGSEYIVLTYSAWLCGACITPLPMELADGEKQQILLHISIDAIISTASLDLFEDVVAQEPIALTEKTWLIKIQKLRPAPPELTSLNPAFIRFTSGTTGNAKGVILSHETILERIQTANSCLKIDSTDRVVWLLSMSYHFAVSIVAYLTFGATIILSKNSFGSSILDASNLHHATVIYAAPTHYELMTHVPEGELPETLRLAIVTTAYLRPEVGLAFRHRFGRALNETYGIIEVGLPAINIDSPDEHQGSVGRVLPAYEIKLDHQNQEGIGEILLRGPGLLDAYYQPWQGRVQILNQRDGWLATGDLGSIDADGFLRIVGRSKELISVAGMKFFPQEVESVLEKLPAVHKACVFAIKARRTGEIPISHLVLEQGQARPTDAQLNEHCTSFLASYKIPVEFHWVDRLAYTASGKLIRNADLLHRA